MISSLVYLARMWRASHASFPLEPIPWLLHLLKRISLLKKKRIILELFSWLLHLVKSIFLLKKKKIGSDRVFFPHLAFERYFPSSKKNFLSERRGDCTELRKTSFSLDRIPCFFLPESGFQIASRNL